MSGIYKCCCKSAPTLHQTDLATWLRNRQESKNLAILIRRLDSIRCTGNILKERNRKTKKKSNHAYCPLRGAADKLSGFHDRFTANFHTKTRNLSDISKKYRLGLFQTPKKNMERMAEVIPNSNDQAFQHFLSQSPWDEDNLIAQVAHDANRLIGGHKDTCLIIDESGIPKKRNQTCWCCPTVLR